MGLAILAVVLLLYILLAYFAAKTWQVWPVVLLVFLFIFSFAFFFLASATLKVQQRWRSQYTTAMNDIEREQQNQERLTMGSLGGDEPGEIELRGDVKRILVGRGRVWRNLRLADLGDGQVLLDPSAWSETGCISTEPPADDNSFASDEDEAPAEGEATVAQRTLGLDADAVVYAFKETPIRALPESLQTLLLDSTDGEDSQQAARCNVPAFYMGEYRIVGDPNADPNAMTLAPTMPLTEPQIQQLQDPDAAWVLYEVMPIDAHEVFEGLSAEQMAQFISPGSMDGEAYRTLIDSYVRDLQPGNDMDPPERKWMTIKFIKPEAIEVDVEVSTGTGEQPLADSLFDPSGRSVVAALNQGEKTEFHEGDEATFDFATAQELISQGKAEPVQPIFHRRLRDYARTFRTLNADIDELARQMELADSDLAKLNESIKQLQTQVTFQTQQREALAGDVNGLQSERQVLGQYLGDVEKKWGSLKSALSRLYRTNRQLEGRLAAVE